MVVWHGGCQSEEEIELEAPQGFEGEEPESGLPAGRVHLAELPAAQVVSTVHTGSCEFLGDAYDALLGWVAREGFVSGGPVREVDLHRGADETRHLTELHLPARRG